MATGSAEHDGLPEDIRDAWNSQDVATTVKWLLSGPVEDRWPDTAMCNGMAVSCVGILLSADPRVALKLLTTLIPRAAPGAGRVHLLEQRIDAAARADDPDDVEATYVILRESLEELAEPQLTVAVLNNTATHLKDARDFDAAQQILRDLLNLPDIQPKDRAAALINLATVLGEVTLSGRRSGVRDIGPALEVLDEARDLAKSLHEPKLLGGVWFNRGFLHGRTGESAQAIQAYDEAWAAYQAAGGDPFDLAYVRRGQAAEAARNGRLSDAAGYFREASGLFMAAGHLDEVSRTNVGLLMAMATSGQPPGRSELTDLLALVELTRPAEVPDLLMNMANIVGTDDPEAALDLYQRAADTFASQHKMRDLCRARHSRAVMMRRLGNPSRALEIMDDIRAQYVNWGIAKEVAEVDFNRALTLTDLERFDEALDAALGALEGLDRHRHTLAGPADRAGIYTHTYRHLFDVALDLARRAGDDDLVAALAERSRVQVNPAERPVPGSEQLAQPPQVAARPGSRPVVGDSPSVDLVGIARDLLNPDAHWLTWARHREQLLRILVTPTQTHVSAVPWPTDLLLDLRDAIADPTDDDRTAAGGDLEAAGRIALYRAATGPLLADPGLADRLRPTLDPGSVAGWEGRSCVHKSLLPELSAAFLPPVLHDLLQGAWQAGSEDAQAGSEDEAATRSALTSLVLAPPTALGRVPWAALPVGSRTLVEGAEFLLAPPLGTLLRPPSASRRRTRTDDTEMAAPSGHILWLVDTRGDLSHCRATRADSGTRMSFDSSPPATREAVLDALVDPQIDTLVIRSHVRAGSPGDPLSTSILLSGNTELTARELLNARVAVPPRCIVLGCDAAGAATGSEWAGLPLGLSSAGATVLLMTLWPVVDDHRQEQLDLDLLEVALSDPSQGFKSWQQTQARRWREQGDVSAEPYRWANLCLIATSRTGVDV